MSVSNKITRYQEKIGRNKGHPEKLIYYIHKLHELPISVKHLEETHIGWTIYELRKLGGAVRNAAKALISKWKRKVCFEVLVEEQLAEMDALSISDGNDSTEMPQDINEKGHISSTQSINCNVSKDHHCHIHKHHNCNRRGTLNHNKKCKDLDNESSFKKDRIKIKLEKLHAGGENNKQKEKKSFSSSSSEHKHCSKRSENEIKCLESKHCHKEQGLKRKAGPDESYNDVKKSKSCKKIMEKVILGDSVDHFTEALRLRDAVRNKRPSSTTTSKMQNSHSNSFSSTKTTESHSNYNPLRHLPLMEKAAALDAKQVTLPKQPRPRTKVYSGMKTGQPVPTLYELCMHVIKKHIDTLEYTGGVPYDILKPILQQATAEQLFQVEYYNPYLIEHTNELWELHCQKELRSGQLKPMESASKMYRRCLAEREAKLEAITFNIQQMKLAYVDNPKPTQNLKIENHKEVHLF